MRHPCEQCDFKGVYKKDLSQHIKIQHERRRFNCGECDQSFGRGWHLRRHMGVHTGTSYSCSDEECDQSFTLLDNLKRHKLSKHKTSAKDQKLHVQFEQRVQFEEVNQTSGDEDVRKTIDWVEDIFSPVSETNKYSLSTGVNKITFEQSAQGGSARFESKTNKIETFEEPDEDILKRAKNNPISGSTYWKWRCPECGKQTSNRANLFRHRQNMHLGELVKFFCDQCEFRTKRNSHLKEHVQRMHDN